MGEFREIPLTHGQVALVDLEDYADISQFTWYAIPAWDGKWYARRRVRGLRSNELMHRRILQAPPGIEVDHREDTLDNRRANLRLATTAQNQWNRGLSRSNTSGFKGVCWHRRPRQFVSRIRVNGHRFHLGGFADPVEAAKAYDRAALRYHGPFARLNFP